MSFSENRLRDTVVLEVRLPYITADEHMAGGIPCCPKFFVALPDQWLYIVKNVCMYTRTYAHTHTHRHLTA
jgi:hypothetical protein